MTVKQFYAAIGGDYDGTLFRMLTEERMYRFALRFEGDPSYSALLEALGKGNVDEAFRAAHTLKGLCGNLGFSALGEIASEITEILRVGSLEVGALLDELKAQYEVTLNAVLALKASGYSAEGL